MIINRNSLLKKAPIENMLETKMRHNGVSHGLAEAGYDIRIAQDIVFSPSRHGGMLLTVNSGPVIFSRFTIASAMELFQMPDDLVGRVCDKSTWARRGLSVFNTVIEPGWKGYLTLELVYHGNEYLEVLAGTGIAQVLFEKIDQPIRYNGKYQNQENRPVEARLETSQGELFS
jgi:dCTP deaminase